MRLFILCLALILGACTTTVPVGLAGRDASLIAELHDPDGRVMVAAHRGCWAEAPENSLAALEACGRLGVDIVEVDLRLTADGEVVVFHDRTLARMAGRELAIANMTLDEVRAVRLKDRDGRGDAQLTEEAIPTFRDILRANDRRMLLILDLKYEPSELAPLAAAILREEGACDIALFALVAPAEEVRAIAGPLYGCAGYLPNLRLPMGVMSEVVNSYSGLDPVAVAVRFDDWDYLYEGADDVARLPARLWVNTLDDHHAAGLTDADALIDPDALWGRLVDAGVNMIQTDEPAALIDYLAGRD